MAVSIGMLPACYRGGEEAVPPLPERGDESPGGVKP